MQFKFKPPFHYNAKRIFPVRRTSKQEVQVNIKLGHSAGKQSGTRSVQTQQHNSAGHSAATPSKSKAGFPRGASFTSSTPYHKLISTPEPHGRNTKQLSLIYVKLKRELETSSLIPPDLYGIPSGSSQFGQFYTALELKLLKARNKASSPQELQTKRALPIAGGLKDFFFLLLYFL